MLETAVIWACGNRSSQRSVRQRLIAGPVLVAPKAQVALGADPRPTPFTLVIQMDAWNIRERDPWGKTQPMRNRKEELKRWPWVYTATCFRLEQRGRKGKQNNKLRALITERSSVATRGGVEALRPQRYYEARHWVKPLLRPIRNDPVAAVLTHLQDLQLRLEAAAANRNFMVEGRAEL